jgi:transformation/transcription domain-associated protein
LKIDSDKAFPKDIMQECIRPILISLKDSRKLTIPILKGLECVLRLVTNKAYVQFGDKFIEHLKLWTDPETIMSMSVWIPGEEQSIAAAMMNLFYLLPWNTAIEDGENCSRRLKTFLRDYFTITMRLESIRSQFRHQPLIESPFLSPIAKFLSRYSSEAMEYILCVDQMKNEEVMEFYKLNN